MEPSAVLSAWSLPPGTTPVPADSGLINQSWVLRGQAGPVGVLQWLNTRVFDARLHENIEAVTSRLAERGVVTPRLVRTSSGDLWHTDADGGVWRVLTFVGDRTVHKLANPADAVEAGALVARFHAALDGFDRPFAPMWAPALAATRGGFHDTPAFMSALESSVPRHPGHRLYDDVAALADAILGDFRALPKDGRLPSRVVHGDLKISNVRFQGDVAVALIDLDTLSRGTLDAELGDAFRSWCNPSSEDDPSPRFDLGLFEAGIRGYARHAAATDDEWASIVVGTERIALELASRFARDALEESYFGFDPKYGGRGEHNLLRARGQHALARAVRAARSEAEKIVRDSRR